MKSHLSIFIAIPTVFFSLLPVYGQTKPIGQAIEIEELRNRVDSIESKMDTYIHENNAAAYRTLLDNYSTLLQQTDVRLNIIFSILTLLTIGIPVFNYFTVIKPGIEAKIKAESIISSIEETIRSHFDAFIHDYQKTTIDNSLNNLLSENPDQINMARTSLGLNQDLELTEEQMYKAYSLFDLTDDENTKNILIMLITNKKSAISEKLITKLATDADFPTRYHWITTYTKRHGVENYLELYRDIIASSTEKHIVFIQLISPIIIDSVNSAIFLLNSPAIIDLFEQHEILSIYKSLASHKKLKELNEFHRSYFSIKHQKIMDAAPSA